LEKQIASENIAVRAESYGMNGTVVDGNDPLAVFAAVKEARERALNGEGPSLIEAVTDRLTAHSSDDNDKVYRTKEELEEMRQHDCVLSFANYLKELGILTEEMEEEMNQSIKQKVNEATTYAENASSPDPATLLDYVYETQGGE